MQDGRQRFDYIWKPNGETCSYEPPRLIQPVSQASVPQLRAGSEATEAGVLDAVLLARRLPKVQTPRQHAAQADHAALVAWPWLQQRHLLVWQLCSAGHAQSQSDYLDMNHLPKLQTCVWAVWHAIKHLLSHHTVTALSRRPVTCRCLLRLLRTRHLVPVSPGEPCLVMQHQPIPRRHCEVQWGQHSSAATSSMWQAGAFQADQCHLCIRKLF